MPDDLVGHVGFTGTREGMTQAQRQTVTAMLPAWSLVHHGDCVGADADVHGIALQLDLDVVIHPPTSDKNRAFCSGSIATHAPLPYLTRDRVIVDSSSVLLATPLADHEQWKGGTWYTIHYAQKKGKPIFIVWPDGTYECRNPHAA